MPRKPRTTTPAPGHNSIDKAKLKELVQRIEEAEDDRIAITEDIRGLYAEARSSGFDATALRQVIKMRRQDKSELDARQAVIDEYMSALGMLQGTPLGNYAMQRDGLAPPV